MRILKKKIEKSVGKLGLDKEREDSLEREFSDDEEPIRPKRNKKANKKTAKKKNGGNNQSKKKKWTDSKNIIKNYGKAMCSFATSEVALPYLLPLCKQEQISPQRFVPWIQGKKENLDTIEGIRNCLLVYEGDTPEISSFKRVFQQISEIFLKYFAVNWIYSGKLTHRLIHLYFRFKMLRRVRNPEAFTYLKASRRKKY